MSDYVHIVCLDAPSPPDYGGAIDMFYKIKALGNAGKKVILHYFGYRKNRGHAGLQEYYEDVFSYQRRIFSLRNISRPYIIASRINQQLIRRLNADNYPIILEGLHTAGIIPYLKNQQRIVLRMHNEEAGYYQQLAAVETNPFKKLYFKRESRLLEEFQHRLPKHIFLAALSSTDLDVFRDRYHFKNLDWVPCFIGWQTIIGKPGSGSYCLYHGNLSVGENEAAAQWLVENVFSKIDVPFIIAGKGISARLKSICAKYPNISCVNNPSLQQLDGLIEDAHINVLPSWNSTGVKLKLLHACFTGRFLITNDNGHYGSGLSGITELANTPGEYINKINELMSCSFGQADLEKRKAVADVYDNAENARKLSARL